MGLAALRHGLQRIADCNDDWHRCIWRDGDAGIRPGNLADSADHRHVRHAVAKLDATPADTSGQWRHRTGIRIARVDARRQWVTDRLAGRIVHYAARDGGTAMNAVPAQELNAVLNAVLP